MKVLLDTCVVLDFLQKRDPFAQDALSVFRNIADDKLSGCITAKAMTDIYYLMHRTTHSDEQTRNILTSLLSVVRMVDTEAADVISAMTSKTADFEDAVMIETAVREHADGIVTRNQKDYVRSPVPVYSPAELLMLLDTKTLKKLPPLD